MNRNKFMAILLLITLLFMAVACTTPVAPGNTSAPTVAPKTDPPETSTPAPEEPTDPVTLVVDLHGWMPTLNTEPTEENPTVFQSPQLIADAFTDLYPHITIEWARTKPVGGLQAELAEWFTTQINAGTVPAIAFSWGTSYQDRGWYLPLDEFLDTPNEFVEGNTKWRDMFPEYLWTKNTIADANRRVVAIPIALYPGPPTGYFYNKAAFADAGIQSVPATWEELLAASAALKEKGYTGIAHWGFFNSINFGAWVQQFSIGPYIAASIMDQTDYDGNGQVETFEQLRGIKAGLYNPIDKPYAQELFRQIKRYYTQVLEPGWENTDYGTPWNEGKVGIREDGMWALPTESGNMGREFDYGVFPAPPISKDTTEYAADVVYTEKGPFQPEADLQLNIMKDAVEGNDAMLDAAVKFLKFLTTPENNSVMVLEQGADIGAVKGSSVPPILAEWLNQSFAITPKAGWPGGGTDEQNLALDKALEIWVKDGMSDEEFFKAVNEIQQKGADDLIISMEVDTSGW